MTTTLQEIELVAGKLMAGELPAERLESAIPDAGLTGIPPRAADEINSQIDHSPRLAHALASVFRALARREADTRQCAEAHLLFIRTLNAVCDFREAVAQCGDAARAFLALGEPKAAARTWLEAALAETYLGNLEPAREYLALARGLISSETSPLLAARAEWLEGRILRDQGEYAQAARLFEHARQVLSAAGETPDALRCQRELGHTYARTDPAKALPVLAQARDIFEQADYPVEVAWCSHFLGQAYHDLNQYAAARENLEAASKIFAEHGLRLLVAWTAVDLGILEWRLNRFDEALRTLEQAHAHFESSGSDAEASSCDINIGLVLIDQNHYEEALERLQHALQQGAASGRRKKVAICHENI
jgi:tetratricopeptide (TPR) repeat protein